jgi:hypothetical protein
MALIIGKDQNTYKKIFKRLNPKKDKGAGDKNYMQAMSNVFVNLWYTFINNFYIVYYYYFMPITCVLI